MAAQEKQSKSINSNQRGGKRAGAGRKAGVRNKRTEEVVKAIEESGLTPLDYMLKVMRQNLPELPKLEDVGVAAYAAAVKARERIEAIALDAAKSAAPYCHAKLQAIEVTGKDGKDLIPHADDRELARRVAFVLNGALAKGEQDA